VKWFGSETCWLSLSCCGVSYEVILWYLGCCIAENSVFNERTKHIIVNCHLVRQKIKEKIAQTRHVWSDHQLTDLLTKSLGKTRVDFIFDKLGMYDVYALIWGSVRKYDLYKEWYMSMLGVVTWLGVILLHNIMRLISIRSCNYICL